MLDTIEPGRQNVEQEATADLVRAKHHHLSIDAASPIILVAKGDSRLV